MDQVICSALWVLSSVLYRETDLYTQLFREHHIEGGFWTQPWSTWWMMRDLTVDIDPLGVEAGPDWKFTEVNSLETTEQTCSLTLPFTHSTSENSSFSRWCSHLAT